MKKGIVGLLVLFSLSILVFAFSGCRGGGSYHGKGGGHYGKNNVFKLVKKLDLSGKQEEAINKLKKDYYSQRKFKKGFASRNAKNRDLGKFFLADEFDKEAFKANAKEKIEKRKKKYNERITKIIEKRADKLEKIFNILNAKQRAKLVELSKK